MSALTDAIDEFVVPFYLLVLHANYIDGAPAEQTNFIGATRRAMANITDAALELLLNSGGWREMLAASWFIGLNRREHYVDWLGDLLVAAEPATPVRAFALHWLGFAPKMPPSTCDPTSTSTCRSATGTGIRSGRSALWHGLIAYDPQTLLPTIWTSRTPGMCWVVRR